MAWRSSEWRGRTGVVGALKNGMLDCWDICAHISYAVGWAHSTRPGWARRQGQARAPNQWLHEGLCSGSVTIPPCVLAGPSPPSPGFTDLRDLFIVYGLAGSKESYHPRRMPALGVFKLRGSVLPGRSYGAGGGGFVPRYGAHRGSRRLKVAVLHHGYRVPSWSEG